MLGVYDPAGVAGLSYAEAKRLADHRNALLNRGASVETAVVLPEPVIDPAWVILIYAA